MIGQVMFDNEFQYKDGGKGRKLFVVLAGGGDGEDTALIVQTTSKASRYSRVYGCNAGDRFLNFHIPREARLFNEDSWIQLEDFFELRVDELIEGRWSKRITYEFTIPENMMLELLACAQQSEDLSGDYMKRLEASSAELA